MARRFFYLSMGLLALSAAYHLGAVRTEAQGGGQFIGLSVGGSEGFALTSNGDVWRFNASANNPNQLYPEFIGTSWVVQRRSSPGPSAR